MKFRISDTEVIISPVALALVSLAVYSGKLKLSAAVLLSVAAHEAGHLFAMKLLNAKITSIRFDPWGFCIECGGIVCEKDKLLSALAGPASGALLCLLCTLFSELSFFGLLFKISMSLTFLNILPCPPLDGGNIAVSALKLMLPGSNLGLIIRPVSYFISSVFMTAGVIFLVKGSGLFFFIIGMYIIYYDLRNN